MPLLSHNWNSRRLSSSRFIAPLYTAGCIILTQRTIAGQVKLQRSFYHVSQTASMCFYWSRHFWITRCHQQSKGFCSYAWYIFVKSSKFYSTHTLVPGACMRSRTNFSADSLNFAPFVLVPSTFPRKEFEKAVEMQPLVNELVHKIANNHEFLTKTLASYVWLWHGSSNMSDLSLLFSRAIENDPFTSSLFEIYKQVYSEGITQVLHYCCHVTVWTYKHLYCRMSVWGCLEVMLCLEHLTLMCHCLNTLSGKSK